MAILLPHQRNQHRLQPHQKLKLQSRRGTEAARRTLLAFCRQPFPSGIGIGVEVGPRLRTTITTTSTSLQSWISWHVASGSHGLLLFPASSSLPIYQKHINNTHCSRRCCCVSGGISSSCSCACRVDQPAGRPEPLGFRRILPSEWGRSSGGGIILGGNSWESLLSPFAIGSGPHRGHERLSFRPRPRREKGGGRRWSHSCHYVPLFWDEENPEVGSSLPVDRQFANMVFKKEGTLPISIAPSGATILEGQKMKNARMTRRGAIVALSYMLCAVMLVMFNKAALSTYKFPCANIITVLQMVCSTVTLFVLRKLDVISFANEGSGSANLAEGGFVSINTLQRASPLAISYLFYMVVGMASIRGVNVPMYTTLRRTTVLFTMIMEFLLTGQKHSVPTISTVSLIVTGAFIAGARDLSFDSYGYLVVLFSNLTTALYLTTISRLGKSTGLNSFGLMWCNGLICGPILLFWTMLSGELATALQFSAAFVPSFQLVIWLSCMMAFCLNYTIFLNTSLNSALTQTMCGNLKDVGTVLIGWLWFGGLPFDWVNISDTLLNLRIPLRSAILLAHTSALLYTVVLAGVHFAKVEFFMPVTQLNVLGQLLGFLGSGLYAYCKIRGV